MMKRTISSKLKLPTTDDKARLKRACSTAVSALQTILNVAKDVAGNVGPPGLQAGITGLILVLDVAQKTSQNAKDVEQLKKRIDDLKIFLENAKDGDQFSETIIGRIDRLSATWTAVGDEVQKMASRNLFKRTINYSDDVESISNHIKTITWSMESFTVESVLAIEFTLDEQCHVARRIEGKLDNVAQNMDIGFQQVKGLLALQDGHPPHAVSARFDCRVRERCLEGTRSDILELVEEWIKGGDSTALEATGSARNLPIFWINGSAGTGKTTIASTVADNCSKREILGASFFCSRDNAECSNPNLVFPTIAYQLGQFCPSFKAEVTQALAAKPDIGYSDVPYQLEELIVKPLRAVGNSFPPCVIVLDALDECKDGGATSIILSSLSRYDGELSALKILVTSRPERNIVLPFSDQLSSATKRLVLHEVELEVVQKDIEQYLTEKLAVVRKSYQLDSLWPSVADIHALAHLSVGLFVFASTSVKFIKDENYSDPRRQLSDLLRNTAESVRSPSSPHRHLDQLYMEVLNHAFPDMSYRLVGRLKMILGTIVLLRDPLSVVALERLLNLREGTVRETLAYLHSVVIVPDDVAQVIRLHHPSFFDFMTSPSRCLNPKLVVNTRTQHTLLAWECLKVMKDLRRDICDIRNPSMLNNQVDDLQTRITRNIPAQLQYACRHWAFHLTNGMISVVLLNLMKEFCSEHLLHWVEVCSLLGELRNALLALDAAQKALAAVVEDTTGVIALLHDCELFTRQFFPVISTSSLQVYHSALLFTPQETLIYKRYQQELMLPMKVYNGSEKTWNLCLRAMDGHSDTILAVAFSSDGTRVVSGSADKTIRLWDVVSGIHLNTLKGHSESVKSVAFSPDATRVVSGSYDNTIRLWDAVSGTHFTTLKGHTGWVNSVAFSLDGTRIVSASFDKTIRLWDAASGTHLNTLKGHTSWVNSVAFSPDGTRVVSASSDKRIQLWDAVSGTQLITFKGHPSSVHSVTFSADGTRVVSGFADKTILWDAVRGTHLNTLKGHAGWVNSVAFSPDGTRVVSGSADKTVRLWDAVSGTHLNTLKGHSESVHSVAFSPDGTRVVSGSVDKTVRLWDAVNGAHLDTLERHSEIVQSVAFSPDGTRVVSGSADKIVRLWDAASGRHLITFKGHTKCVNSVTFSSDGTRVASGSTDNTIRLWDAVGSTHPNTLKGHTADVQSVAFSPDGTRVVSASWDTTICLWDAFSGTHLNTLKGHTDWVNSVAFSPDGARVVSGSKDVTVRLWDTVSGTHLNTLVGHSEGLHSVAFSPDGTRVVSGSIDKTVRLWDAVSGAHLDTIEGLPFSVTSVAKSLTLSQSSLPRSHPVAFSSSTKPPSSYFMEDGWVYSLPQQRRICWIPISCRPHIHDSNGNRVALATDDRRIVILDLTGMDS